MTQLSTAPPGAPETETPVRQRRGFLQALEIDLRVFGMFIALAMIILGFGVLTDGDFLRPVNMVNLAVQSVSVAIIATGMTLVIVARHIDLSVGAIVGVVGMSYAYLMARVLPGAIGGDNPWLWVIALVGGLILGCTLGAVQGAIVAYIGVPSFVVTLGGLLVFRGLSWLVTKGSTIAPIDATFRRLNGDPRGSIGGTASWIVGAIGCIGISLLLANARRERRKFGFPLRPMWAEIVVGTVSCAFVLGLVWLFNSYKWPDALAERYAAETGITIPPGGLAAGIPIPVLLLVVVTLVMTFVATRRKYGRYVFAIGGNPEAADLAGINTKRTVMKTFMLIGLLCALSAAVGTARLDGATHDLGEGYELYVIAAAVIGGTSFAGGIGTIPGAVLGALVMSSLAYGLSYMGLSSPIQDIFAGIVLVAAVAFDTITRRRKR
jgi:D-xylose transport system permease protein